MELPPTAAYTKQLKTLVYALGSLYTISPKSALEGVAVCRELGRHGLSSTLGRFSKAGDDPLHLVDEYCLASNALKGASATDPIYLSLKPPALQFNPEHVIAIASTAFLNGHAIHFDSHSCDVAQPTLALLEQLIDRRFPQNEVIPRWKFSLTLPSRWRRSMADAEWAAERGIRTRLVKGEFGARRPFEETDPRKGFLALIDKLAGRVPEIAVATHDCSLAREALARCKDAGSPVQLELLFGIPAGDMLALSREMAVPVRYYVPYGDTLLIYGIRHFLANPHKLLRPNSLEVISSSRSKLATILRFLRTATESTS